MKRSWDGSIVGQSSIVVDTQASDPQRNIQQFEPSKRFKPAHFEPSVTYKSTKDHILASDSKIRTKALVNIVGIIPFNNNQENEDLIISLRKQLVKEDNNHNKAIIIRALTTFATLIENNRTDILVDFITQLKDEQNGKIRPTVAQALINIVKSAIIEPNLLVDLFSTSFRLLNSDDPLIREKSILLLVKLFEQHYNTSNITDRKQVFPKLEKLLEVTLTVKMSDSDYRVRTTAIESLVEYFKINDKSMARVDRLTIYSRAAIALQDDVEEVRLAAMGLLNFISSQYNHFTVKKEGENGQLVDVQIGDDAFQKICNMVNDFSLQVRQRAVNLLGDMKEMNSQMLLQTLSKRILEFVGDKPFRSKNYYFDEERIQGYTEGDIDIVKSKYINISDATSAGAFVHGLEDEFLEVRNAAIDSIRKLAQKSDEFARTSLEFLVDMFNDEIDSIRINSVNSVTNMGTNIQLNDEQLTSVLTLFSDHSHVVRDSLRALLQTTRLSNVNCLNSTIEAILGNIQKYPQDLLKSYFCLKKVGANHPFLTELIVEDLLRLDMRYKSREPIVDDQFYIGIVISVFNAAVGNSSILSLLPHYAEQHYFYLKNKYPQFIPNIEFYARKSGDFYSAKVASATAVHVDVDGFFSEILQRIATARAMSDSNQCSEAVKIIKLAQRDLQRIGTVDNTRKATADFLFNYLSSIKTFTSAQNRGRFSLNHLQQVLHKSYLLQHSFAGIEHVTLDKICAMRVSAHLKFYMSTASSDVTEYKKLMDRLTVLLRTLSASSPLIEHVKSLVTHFEQNKNQVPDVNTTNQLAALDKVLSTHWMSLEVPKVADLKQSRAQITWPNDNADKPAEFVSSLPHALTLRGTLEGQQPSDLMVKLTYPDGTTSLYYIEASNFEWDEQAQQYSFETKLQIHVNPFTDKCGLKFTVVKVFQPDVTFDASLLPTDVTSQTALTWNTSINAGLIDISAPHMYHILPKRTK
jgi:integrator complex subunit 4